MGSNNLEIEAMDLIIRNGRRVDGTGLPAFSGDLGIRDGRVVHVGGRIPGSAAVIVNGELAWSAGEGYSSAHSGRVVNA